MTTVTSNEEFVRLRIYDGEIPLDEAGAELLRLERQRAKNYHQELIEERKSHDAQVRVLASQINNLQRQLEGK